MESSGAADSTALALEREILPPRISLWRLALRTSIRKPLGAISAVISDMPVTPGLLRFYPMLAGAASVPCGLGYWLVSTNLAPVVNHTSLRPLPAPPRDPSPTTRTLLSITPAASPFRIRTA